MKKKKISAFDFCILIFMLIVLFITIYPLYYTVIASLSDPKAVATGKVVWFIEGFTLSSYEHVFRYKDIWIGYGNTIFYTLFGTMFNIFLTIPTGYALSKKYLPYRGLVVTFFLITMYFSGGMIPDYLLRKSLGLINTRWVIILTGGISIYNMIVTKSYFTNSISDSLYEAADMDGAGEIKKFLAIGVPLAKPIIAVMVLYYAVDQWNNYFNALLYITSTKMDPLQSVLRRVLLQNQNALNDAVLQQQNAEMMAASVNKAYAAYTMKYAVVFIASLPLLVAYPFVQKYFVKGVMVGSVKE